MAEVTESDTGSGTARGKADAQWLLVLPPHVHRLADD